MVDRALVAVDQTARTTILAIQTDLQTHTGNTSNPHNVTKEQVGLGSADDTADTNKNVATARTLATARTIQVNLGSNTAASFNGGANATPGVTGVLGIENGGTDASTIAANSWIFRTSGALLGSVRTSAGLRGNSNRTNDGCYEAGWLNVIRIISLK